MRAELEQRETRRHDLAPAAAPVPDDRRREVERGADRPRPSAITALLRYDLHKAVFGRWFGTGDLVIGLSATQHSFAVGTSPKNGSCVETPGPSLARFRRAFSALAALVKASSVSSVCEHRADETGQPWLPAWTGVPARLPRPAEGKRHGHYPAAVILGFIDSCAPAETIMDWASATAS